MEAIIFFSIIVWIIICVIIGNYGRSRKIGFAGAFAASFFLSPILAMLFVLASDKLTKKEIKEKEEKKKHYEIPDVPGITKSQRSLTLIITGMVIISIFIIGVAKIVSDRNQTEIGWGGTPSPVKKERMEYAIEKSKQDAIIIK